MSAARDVRIARGMARQLAGRRACIETGERPIGWKLGFGSAAAMAQLGITEPLVGFLTDAGVVEPGSTYAISGWTRPMLEPEVAVHMARDVPGASNRDGVETAIGALGPAIELVDLDPPPTDVEEICAGNIYQRGVVLGPTRPGASLAGASGRVFADGVEAASTDDPQGVPGEVVPLVAHVAAVLDGVGERLRAGDVIITGAIVAPLAIHAGSAVRYELDPFGTIELGFT